MVKWIVEIALALIILFLPGILAALDNPGKAADP